MDKEEGWHVLVDNGVCHTTQVESELCIIAPHSTGGAGGGRGGSAEKWGKFGILVEKRKFGISAAGWDGTT